MDPANEILRRSLTAPVAHLEFQTLSKEEDKLVVILSRLARRLVQNFYLAKSTDVTCNATMDHAHHAKTKYSTNASVAGRVRRSSAAW